MVFNKAVLIIIVNLRIMMVKKVYIKFKKQNLN